MIAIRSTRNRYRYLCTNGEIRSNLEMTRSTERYEIRIFHADDAREILSIVEKYPELEPVEL